MTTDKGGSAGAAAASASGGVGSLQKEAAPTHDRPTVAVKIYAPFKVYYEDAAYSISAVNATGPFDILPRHHNFLCLLMPCNLVVDTPRGTNVVRISRGLMHVKADRVVVFLDV